MQASLKSIIKAELKGSSSYTWACSARGAALAWVSMLGPAPADEVDAVASEVTGTDVTKVGVEEGFVAELTTGEITEAVFSVLE